MKSTPKSNIPSKNNPLGSGPVHSSVSNSSSSASLPKQTIKMYSNDDLMKESYPRNTKLTIGTISRTPWMFDLFKKRNC